MLFIENDQELAENLAIAGFNFLGESTQNGLDSIYIFQLTPEILLAAREEK